MKYFLVPVAAAITTGYVQAQQVQIPAQRLSELRMAVHQSHANPATAAGPRRLTALERAELRRQVMEHSRKPTKS